MTHQRRSLPLLPDIPGLYGFIVFVTLFIFDGGKALLDGDTFWHIKAGMTMLEQGSLLTQDIFSHTARGISWTAHEWLAEIIMAGLHRWAGLQGVALFYFLIAALSFWLLFRLARRLTNEWLALLWVSLAFAFSMTHLLARPHIFSWLFAVCTLTLLQHGGRARLLLLPLIALWANLHGGFVLGLALQAIFIAGALLDTLCKDGLSHWRTALRAQKFALIILLASLAASGLNPFGYHLLIFPFLVTKTVFTTGIGEWLAPDMQKEVFFRFYLLMVIFLVSLPRLQIDWTNRLLLIFWINASLAHGRYISMAAVFLVPLLAQIGNQLLSKLSFENKTPAANNLQLSPYSGIIATAGVFFILFAASTFQSPIRSVMTAIISLNAENHPVAAVKFLNSTPLPGKMFNKYGWGGYLIYALEPSQSVFIDGRADMYGEDLFAEYRKVVAIDKDIETILEKHEVNWVIYPHDTPLVRYLLAGNRWQEIYQDEEACVLLRNPSPLP
jgi:hypothetical protein